MNKEAYIYIAVGSTFDKTVLKQEERLDNE